MTRTHLKLYIAIGFLCAAETFRMTGNVELREKFQEEADKILCGHFED